VSLRSNGSTVARWLKERIDACDLFGGFTRMESKIGSIDLLGKAMWVAFALIVISGIGLLGGYSPTIARSFISVEYLQNEYPLGWWFRGIHKWGCDLFIILGFLRILRIAFRRTYKAPGEIDWLSAIGLVSIAIAGGLTGYLLVWNQRAFEMGGTMGGLSDSPAEFEKLYPLGGLALSGWLSKIILGGQELSQAGLSMTFAAHIAIGLFVLVWALCWRTWPRPKFPGYMDFSLRVPPALLWTIAFGLSFIALILPPPLGSVTDTILHPHPALADWFLLDFYQLIDSLGPTAGISIMGAGSAIIILIPWLDRTAPGVPQAGVKGLFIGFIVASIILSAKKLGWQIPDNAMFGLIALAWFVIFGIVVIAERLRPQSINNIKARNRGEVGEE